VLRPCPCVAFARRPISSPRNLRDLRLLADHVYILLRVKASAASSTRNRRSLLCCVAGISVAAEMWRFGGRRLVSATVRLVTNGWDVSCRNLQLLCPWYSSPTRVYILPTTLVVRVKRCVPECVCVCVCWWHAPVITLGPHSATRTRGHVSTRLSSVGGLEDGMNDQARRR